MTTRSHVHGLAIAGAATVRAMQRHGWLVTASDDHTSDRVRATAEELGVELIPARVALEALDQLDVLSPAPGIAETHPLVLEAQRLGLALMSEIELAYRWEQQRLGGPRPMLAVTGTDGKTTTTLLATEMLEAAGRRPAAAGNTELPLLDALELEADSFVVECTSFRLAWTEQFRSEAAVWLNLAPDHLNWHRSLNSYVAAKARIFQLQRSSDIAIGFAEDPVVMEHLRAAPGRGLTFAEREADYRVEAEMLTGPHGRIGPVNQMRRSLPHDVTNALAAAAMVLETGLADTEAVNRALATFVGPPHRIEAIGETHGVRWFNDSKATTPHAASVALAGFDSVVLIAGGRNKGLDLTGLRAHADHLRAVVAIGEAAAEIEAVFHGACPVSSAGSMEDAVLQAAARAQPGDVVLLSPGCASFDWYPDGGYPARGDHFRRLVEELVSASRPGGSR
jgi:UDP-N-acetylmuramoylalanine--D-glutamate ligase